MSSIFSLSSAPSAFELIPSNNPQGDKTVGSNQENWPFPNEVTQMIFSQLTDRQNAGITRVCKNWALLQSVGIFKPKPMVLNPSLEGILNTLKKDAKNDDTFHTKDVSSPPTEIQCYIISKHHDKYIMTTTLIGSINGISGTEIARLHPINEITPSTLKWHNYYNRTFTCTFARDITSSDIDQIENLVHQFHIFAREWKNTNRSTKEKFCSWFNWKSKPSDN